MIGSCLKNKNLLTVDKVNIKDYHFSDDWSLILNAYTFELFTKEKNCCVEYMVVILFYSCLPCQFFAKLHIIMPPCLGSTTFLLFPAKMVTKLDISPFKKQNQVQLWYLCISAVFDQEGKINDLISWVTNYSLILVWNSALICNFTCEITNMSWQPSCCLSAKVAARF